MLTRGSSPRDINYVSYEKEYQFGQRSNLCKHVMHIKHVN